MVGDVKDINTAVALSGVAVSSPAGSTTTNGSGFYTLFSPAGSMPITASLANYKTEVATVTVPLSGTVRQDFLLGAGKLDVAPAAINVSLTAGGSTTVPMTLTNSGNLAATLSLIELDKGGVPYGPFEKPSFVVKPFRQDAWRNAIGLGIPNPPAYPPYAAGDVIQSWTPTGVTGPWGLAYDGNDGTVWVSSPSAAWLGTNQIFEFTPAGTATGRSYTYNWNPPNGPADAAYNWNTGMVWVMNINTGVANCIFEIDPASGPTGNKICPTGATGFATSQRGLTYDPSTDTYFAGGWNDQMVYQFKSDGTLLNSKNVGLAVAGLAYNPTTQHLFVVDNAATTQFYVFDAANNYAPLGSFTAAGFSTYGGTGLEIDCDGNLWAVDNAASKVYQINSGETASFCKSDVPWLSTSPVTGTVASAGVQPIAVTVDSTGVQPGVYNAQIKSKHNTPYNVPNVPVTMTVTVPPTWGKITGNVLTQGYCDANPAALNGVTVTVQSATTSWNLLTDDTGQYNYWLDQSNSPLTVTVNLPGYEYTQYTGVNVVGQGTTTNDFTLRWLQPCLTINPPAIVTTLSLGQSTTRPFRLTNAGAASTAFSMTEQNVSSPTAAPEVQLQAGTNPVALSANPVTNSGSAAPWLPTGNVSLTVDDGSAENSIGLTAGGQFLWLNRFTPAAGSYPFTLDQVSVLFPTTTPTGSSMQIVIWEDKDGDGNPGTGAHFLYSQDVTVQTNDGATWNVYNLTTPVLLTGPGDVLIGLVNRGASLAGQYPASIDQNSTLQRRSWIGLYSAGNPPNPPTLPADSTFGIIDDVGGSTLAGNWTLRGSGHTSGGASSDVVWLTETPVSGTVAADSFLNTTIGFNANVVAVPGTYKANVNVNSFDPKNPTRTANMTMNVTAPASWGVLTGTFNSLGYCDANPTPLAGAAVVLQAVNGLTRTVTTDANGGYTLWLNSATNPYTLTATAPQHVGSTPLGGLTVSQLGAVTAAPPVNLRSIQPCVDYTPDSLSVTVPWQGSASQTLTLTNSGAASSLYTITEKAGGFIPMTPQALTFLIVGSAGTNVSAIQTALTAQGNSSVLTTTTAFNGLQCSHFVWLCRCDLDQQPWTHLYQSAQDASLSRRRWQAARFL